MKDEGDKFEGHEMPFKMSTHMTIFPSKITTRGKPRESAKNREMKKKNYDLKKFFFLIILFY